MEALIAFWLFTALVFGAGMLALVMGYKSTEERRALEERDRRAQEQLTAQMMAMMPRFFARSDAIPTPPVPVALDERRFADLESYVRAEQALVAQFVAEPSVDSLYRQPSVGVVN